MGKVLVMEHPLIQHKVGIIRRKKSDQKISERSSARLQCICAMRRQEI